MAGSSIADKVKAGLSNAVSAVGDGETLIYLQQLTVTSDPILGDTETAEWVELPNAIFKSYSKSIIGETILAGDRELVSNGDIKIMQNDIIKSNDVEYIVKAVDKIEPAGVVLVYKSQVRAK